MQTIKVTPKTLTEFINFPEKLYSHDPNYVPYMRADLKKTLKKLLFESATYTALITKDDSSNTLARVLFTIDASKKLNTEKCGFFSMYECVDNEQASLEILSEMKRILTEQGAEFICGTFFPFDPDNRRGILVEGFHRAPLIFTSYNKEYYSKQLEEFGFLKQIDAYEYECPMEQSIKDKVSRLALFSERHFHYHVDHLNKKNPEKDIEDFYCVLNKATTEINYQEAPSMEELRNVVKQWKSFLNEDFILIARLDSDNSPIGITFSLPDYFEVFRAMNGKINPISILRMIKCRKNLKSVRSILQYVIPEYQDKGVLVSLYNQMRISIEKHKINYLELGTIMENNSASNLAMLSIGSKLCRVYRLYYLPLSSL